MTSTKRMLLLVAVTIAMLDATESFQSFISSDGNSSALSGITRRAILQKTAEVCRDLAASQNREFTLRIDNSLVAEEVFRACTGDNSSSIPFQRAIHQIEFTNTRVDSDLKQQEGVAVAKLCINSGNFLCGREALGKVFQTLQDQPLTTLAADQAVNAPMDILEDIRIAVGINSFLRLMDITPSPPLCFVIDTTGTMGFELFRIRALVSRIINERRRTLPTDYILVPFNDPGFGPVTRTSNVDDYNMIVQRLSPLGGGDPPELSLSGLRLALTQSPPYTQVFVITDAPAKDSNLKNNITALIESTECVVNFLLTIGSELAQSEQLYRDIAEASGGLAFVMKKQNFDSALSVVEDSQAGSEVTVFRIKQNPGRQNSFNFAVDVSLRSVTVYIIGASSLTFSLTSPTGVTLSSSQASGPLHSLTKIGDLNRLTLKTENEIGQWQISITSSDPYTVKITGQSALDFFYRFIEDGGVHGCQLNNGRMHADSNASMLVTLTESVGVNVTEVILFSESTQVNGSVQCVGDSRYQVNFTGVPHGMYRVLLKGEDTRSRPCNFQRQSNLKIPTTQICTNSQVPSTNIEPGFNVSVFFQLSVISGGLINQSAVETFSIGASNDRGYPCSFPNTVTIEPGSRGIANDTGTMAVPGDAALGSDVTLTIEAQNAAATDMNFIVIRSQVTDVTPPMWQEVSTSGNCSSSLSLCASSEWEFVANVTDGSRGTGVENITIHQGNGTMSTSIVQAGGETVIVVTYNASCCSQKVELAAVDGAGNVGRIVGQATQSTTAAPSSTATPVSTTTPGSTVTPVSTTTPGSTATPGPTATPGSTATPGPMATPVSTTTPGSTATPGSTVTPVSTTTPGSTATPVSTTTPGSTATPGPTATPVSTTTPGSTATPVSTTTPGSTATTGLMATPGPTATPVSTTTPGSTATPGLTVTPVSMTTPVSTTNPVSTTTPVTTVVPSESTESTNDCLQNCTENIHKNITEIIFGRFNNCDVNCLQTLLSPEEISMTINDGCQTHCQTGSTVVFIVSQRKIVANISIAVSRRVSCEELLFKSLEIKLLDVSTCETVSQLKLLSGVMTNIQNEISQYSEREVVFVLLSQAGTSKTSVILTVAITSTFLLLL